MKSRAVILDRDGTIIEDSHYVRDPEKVVLLEKAAEGLRRLKQLGYKLFVLSNQSGVGRGIISDAQFREVHSKVIALLAVNGVEIDEYLYCFHRPEDLCQCRKPGTGLVPREFQGVPLNFGESFVVGDRDTDLGVAVNLGAKPVLVRTGKGAASEKELAGTELISQSLVVSHLGEFAEYVESMSRSSA